MGMNIILFSLQRLYMAGYSCMTTYILVFSKGLCTVRHAGLTSYSKTYLESVFYKLLRMNTS